MMVNTARAQAAIDSLQAALGSSEGWRITVSRVETTLPVPDEFEGQNTADRSAIREEVYTAVEVGTPAGPELHSVRSAIDSRRWPRFGQ